MQRESLYNPFYIYDSINEHPNMFSVPENNFLKFLKVVPNNKEIICISETNEISLMNLNKSLDVEKPFNEINQSNQRNERNDLLEKINSENINFSKIFDFNESNHVYDCEILYDKNSHLKEDYLKLFFVCSKDNPVRVLNQKGKINNSYLLKNHLEEIINPICLKIDTFDLNLYCGMNKQIVKVDLISDKIEYNKISGESSPISCIDIIQKNNYYISGSYSGKVYLIDKKSNLPFHVIQDKHPRGVNYVKFLKSGESFITAGRKDSEILLWDCRKLNRPIYNFFRKNETNQKLGIFLDSDFSGLSEKEKILYVANSDGTVILYDLLNLCAISYFYANENLETVNSLDLINFESNLDGNKNKNSYKYLVSGTGTRHFVLNEKSSDENMKVDQQDYDNYIKSSFRLWDISELYDK